MEYLVCHHQDRSVKVKTILKPWLIGVYLLALMAASAPSLAQSAASTGGKDLEQLDFANGLFQRDFYDMAMTEYAKFIQRFPQSPYLSEAYFGLAEGAFFLKNYQRAVDLYSQYLQKFPEGARKDLVTLRLGQSLYLLGEYNESLLTLSEVDANRLNEGFRQIFYFYTGKNYRLKDDFAMALDFFHKAADGPDKVQAARALMEMAGLFEERKKYNDAIVAYAKVYTYAKDARVKHFALYKQGEMQLFMKDAASAEAGFRRILKEPVEADLRRDALVGLGWALFQQSKYDQVVAELNRRVGEIQPDKNFFDLFYVGAMAYSRLHKYQDALNLLDRLLPVKDLDADQRHKAAVMKAEILLKLERFDEVMDFLAKQADGQDPDRICFLKAEALYGQKKFQEAYALYRRIVTDFKDSPLKKDALYGAAHARNAAGFSQEAKSLFYEYFQKGEDPTKRAEALYNALVIARKLGMTDDVVAYSRMYLTSFPQHRRAEKALFWLGAAYTDKGAYTEAIETFQEFLKEYPGSAYRPQIDFLLGYGWQQEGRTPKALEFYRRVIKDAKDPDLRYSAMKNALGLYLQTKDEEAAAGMIDRILTEFARHDLQDETVLWLVGRYLDQTRYQDILRVLARTRPPPDRRFFTEAVAYFRAEAYRGLGDHVRAVEQYEVVLADRQEVTYDTPALLGKGLSLMALKRWDEARKALEAVVVEDGADNTLVMRARYELANLARAQGHWEEAAKFFMLVAVLYTDDVYVPKALFYAGEAFEKSHRPADARKAYEELLKTYPDHPLTKKVKIPVEVSP